MSIIREWGSAAFGPNRSMADTRRFRGPLFLLSIFAVLAVLLALAAGSERTQAEEAVQALPSVKVAFIGDSGTDRNARDVLRLIGDQGADFVLHQGDFSYGDEDEAAARVWDEQVSAILGVDYPYFGPIGNHDVSAWSTYLELFQDRLNRNPDAVCLGDYGVNSTCRYKGIFFILSGVGTSGLDHVQFIEDQLAQDVSTWSICSWHKNQRQMQVGGKRDDVGWEAYEACREGGAIIATGHEHSYSRTKTLTDIENQIVDPDWSLPNNVRVIPGSTFVFVSGLGGRNVRVQERCKPTIYPYGCNGEWANLYTSDQGALPGALFVDFNFGGDPDQARGQFINVDGDVIDEFMITAGGENTAPVGEDQQITADANTASEISLNGSDSDGDPLTFRVLTGPSSGVLGGNAPDLTYTPDANFVGSDSFTFVSNDGMTESVPGNVAIAVGRIHADLSFDLLLDPEDGAAGLGLALSRVFDISTNTDVETAWGAYNAKLTYDGTCVKILDIRPKEFSVTIDLIDNGAGIAEFQGNAIPGASGQSDLAQVISRTLASSRIPCTIDVEITNLLDNAGNPTVVFPPSLTQDLRRGDALVDGIVNISDALFIAQYLSGLRPVCTTQVDSTCLHSLNAANRGYDGDFDRVTILDAVFIARHLLGLPDES